MNWDKLRIFHSVAQARSFTHAGEELGLSQSAVSRQISALETTLKVPLFHRHARGLILSEQGEMLFNTVHEMFIKLDIARNQLADTRDKPFGPLRITTTVGLGSSWLTPRLKEFILRYPDIDVELVLSNKELDLTMRGADVALRLRRPVQPDLIQRKLFTVRFHIFASPDYLNEFGTPTSTSDFDTHRIVTYGHPPTYLKAINWLETAGRDGPPRRPVLRVDDIYGLKQAAANGLGIAMLPDYIVGQSANLIRIPLNVETPIFDTYFVYAEEQRASKRINVFRDFLVAKARQWQF
ncbi:MAG: LysR family transcriptional regulator [Alphaproteobacteria bacterium]